MGQRAPRGSGAPLGILLRKSAWAPRRAGSSTDGGASWARVPVIGGSAVVAVAFPTDATGHAVGNRGEILRSANGGETWAAQTSGTALALSDVSFSDESRGWAVGSRGTILRTTDGGVTWTHQTVRLSPDRGLMAVAFVSATEGWAAGGGGTILHTTNGGATWRDKGASYPENYGEVDFTSATSGWVLAEEDLLHTTDAGATWSALRARDFGLTGLLGGLDFVDDATGFCVGANGQIYATADGGLTWASRPSGETVNLRKVRFASATTGWILGDGGVVLRTTDGGATWARRLQSPLSLTTLTVVDADHAIVGGTSGAVLATRDGGASWVRQDTGSAQAVWGIAFPTSTREGILTTATGGF